MRIGKTAGYIGAGLMMLSCGTKPANEKALEHASKYLKGTELYFAEQKARNIPEMNEANYSNAIFYWDSLLCKNREKEFYQKGKQHITDSINGTYKRKPMFLMSFCPKITQKGMAIIDSVKNEVSKYYKGEDFLKLEKKAPDNKIGAPWGRDVNIETHYYGELAIKGAERKGFFEGVKFARDSLLKK